MQILTTFLVGAVIFFALGWYAERQTLHREMERHDEITAEFSRMLTNTRRTCPVGEFSGPELQTITEWADEQIRHFRQMPIMNWRASVELNQAECIHEKLIRGQPVEQSEALNRLVR
jgi:hypothetical protein